MRSNLMILAVSLLVSAASLAQTNGKTPAMREQVYSLLAEAQACAEGSDMSCARRALDEVGAMSDLNSYEAAQLSSFSAFLSFTEDDYPNAIGAYENVLQQPNLPLGLERATMFTLSQLYFQEKQYQQSLGILNRWFSISDDPGPEPYILQAQIHYQLAQYSEGIEPVMTAIQMSMAQGTQPQENWYRLLNEFSYELENYSDAISVLETMIRMWPEREYYIQLSAMYGRVGDQRRQLELYEIAYAMGWLTTSGELVQLSHLLLRADQPEKAVRVLQKGLGTGIVESTDGNLGSLEEAQRLMEEVELGSTGDFPSDSEYQPIIRVAPIYPALAASAGLEGYVIVEFTVTQQGTIKDVSVIESSSSVFEGAAMDSAEKFKYRPRVIEGQPVETHNVRNTITFELGDQA